DGDLLFRESIFHHSQVETPYGPVRQQNSGWFRFDPHSHRLSSFGTYHSTNPWGVTFDKWGQHVASHPIYAAAFHSLDPPYPQQHPRPDGLQAYSGTCGHEFVDTPAFPDELQGHFIKARYKPTNRIEILKWKEGPFGFDEEYVSDLIFSRNLSFIPVDLKFGPRGDLYICDWYNPIKGHAQYSLRDERRDRHSGRIWRVTAKGRALSPAPKIAGADPADLTKLLQRPEHCVRYLAKRELRERDPTIVQQAVDEYLHQLDATDPDYRRHQLEAIWMYRTIRANGRSNAPSSHAASPATPSDIVADRADSPAIRILRELLGCEHHLARAAAVEQLRYWSAELPDAYALLTRAANDPAGIVRMQTAITCSYLGTAQALDVLLQTLQHPADRHVAYAIQCALGSHTLRRHWEGTDNEARIHSILRRLERVNELKEPKPTAEEADFDARQDLLSVRISCLPERMLYSVTQFATAPGQPVKLVFVNPDANDHNLLIVQPDSMAEVGMAANAMARDPQNANSDFIPADKQHLILHASPMIGPTRKTQIHVLRFEAPAEPGIYPFVCTFPGHWVVMNGRMVVAGNPAEAEAILAAAVPQIVREWKPADFESVPITDDEATAMRGMQAFVKARCNQCHTVAGHGMNLGPDLTDVVKRFQGRKLLQQILEPSAEINKKFLIHQFVLTSGKVVSGVITEESPTEFRLVTNLLTPHLITTIPRDSVDEQTASVVSPMPAGLVNVLNRREILDLVSFLQTGGYKLPDHLKHLHQHHEPQTGSEHKHGDNPQDGDHQRHTESKRDSAGNQDGNPSRKAGISGKEARP
ncbi:MAG: HEAT repeat domain-containing protein, partial [Planctomycetaceae bacterium]|nr:HEAT repeat domain-containing protein [Planctomycetaceae bacterium]